MNKSPIELASTPDYNTLRFAPLKNSRKSINIIETLTLENIEKEHGCSANRSLNSKKTLHLARVSPDLTTEKYSYSVTRYSRPFYMTNLGIESTHPEFLPQTKNPEMDLFLNRFHDKVDTNSPPLHHKGLPG